MATAYSLPSKAMIALGAMALITLCFHAISNGRPTQATPDRTHFAALETRIDTLESRIDSLRAAVNQVLHQTETRLPSNIKWPLAKKPSPAAEDVAAVFILFFCIFGSMGWIAALVGFYESVAQALPTAVDRVMAAGVWGMCGLFAGLLCFGPRTEWWCYVLNSLWGFYIGMGSWALFFEDRVADAPVSKKEQ